MADAVVSLGPHIFTAEQLQASLDRTLGQLPPGRTIGIGSALTADGVSAAILWQSKNGVWRAQAAVEHDWAGDNRVGASIVGSW